jgi:hypothetical protein
MIHRSYHQVIGRDDFVEHPGDVVAAGGSRLVALRRPLWLPARGLAGNRKLHYHRVQRNA